MIFSDLKDRFGNSIKCIVSDNTIGGAAEASACTDKFQKEGVCGTITVTPSWCHPTEVIDMDPLIPKAIWGFNGTDMPGAVFLSAAISAHAQKGLPVFAIYGRDVRDRGELSIPDDVKEKILRFSRAAVAVGEMKNKSYLSIGSVSLGMSSSSPDPVFFEDYLGMRCEYSDMTEIIRRIENGIFDKKEFTRAIKWIKDYCREGIDDNVPPASNKEKQDTWAYVVKMAMVVRDMMSGNPVLKGTKHNEESMGRNAIAAGFQGAREWTDFMPNGDFLETILNSSFDWNGKRPPYVLATENDSLNAASMLFGHLLTNSAQIFSDVRTFWSPEAVKRVTGEDLPDFAWDGLVHLINSGPTCLDATGCQQKDGIPYMKPYWEITEEEVNKCLDATLFYPANRDHFPKEDFLSIS